MVQVWLKDLCRIRSMQCAAGFSQDGREAGCRVVYTETFTCVCMYKCKTYERMCLLQGQSCGRTHGKACHLQLCLYTHTHLHPPHHHKLPGVASRSNATCERSKAAHRYRRTRLPRLTDPMRQVTQPLSQRRQHTCFRQPSARCRQPPYACLPA